MKRIKLIACLALVLADTLLARPTTAIAASPTVEWKEQLGTDGWNISSAVSADGLGNVYISGSTQDNLGGGNAGGIDAFVAKYDVSGALLWAKPLGTKEKDFGQGVSADGLGNVYITGSTLGSLGATNAGNSDAFVSKYDASGTLLWTEQFGTNRSDVGFGVSADGLGNVYISGNADDSMGSTGAFISKYEASGTLLWTERLSTRGSAASFGVSADGLGNVYMSGYTRGTLGERNAGGSDAFVSKFDTSGTLLWTEQLGTSSDDYGVGVSADGLGNVYLSGSTRGNLGGHDADGLETFVSKYDADGNLLWTQQDGTTGALFNGGVSADGFGNVYISTFEHGAFGLFDSDVFVSKFDTSGTLLWTEQFGTSNTDDGGGVSADGFGNVYVSGTTYDKLGNANAFIAKFTDAVPEPSSLLLGGMAMLGLLMRGRW